MIRRLVCSNQANISGIHLVVEEGIVERCLDTFRFHSVAIGIVESSRVDNGHHF